MNTHHWKRPSLSCSPDAKLAFSRWLYWTVATSEMWSAKYEVTGWCLFTFASTTSCRPTRSPWMRDFFCTISYANPFYVHVTDTTNWTHSGWWQYTTLYFGTWFHFHTHIFTCTRSHTHLRFLWSKLCLRVFFLDDWFKKKKKNILWLTCTWYNTGMCTIVRTSLSTLWYKRNLWWGSYIGREYCIDRWSMAPRGSTWDCVMTINLPCRFRNHIWIIVQSIAVESCFACFLFGPQAPEMKLQLKFSSSSSLPD